MKKIAILIMLLLAPPIASAEVIIDMTMTTETTTSGASLFEVTALSGTHQSGIQIGAKTLSGLATKEGYFAVQINELTLPSGIDGNNDDTPYELVYYRSLLDDAEKWSKAEEVSLTTGTISGNSTYTQTVPIRWTSNIRFAIKSSTTGFAAATIRKVFK
uniref:Uncharacterized protein n=1 Tax=viral metagenome TaxID=1070528 RepID=A0A6M3K514_9ZZZZ